MLIRMIRDEDTDLGITSQVGWWAAVCGVAESRTRLKRLSSRLSLFFPQLKGNFLFL